MKDVDRIALMLYKKLVRISLPETPLSERSSMGILDRLRRPSTSGSTGLFNQANQHWKLHQEAVLAGDEAKNLREILEVVRYCQQAIAADRRESSAYVLLTNALLVARLDRPDDQATDPLRKYAAAVIHKWWATAPKEYPWIKSDAYAHGVQFYDQLIEEVQRAEGCSSQEAKAKMADYGAEYGDLITYPSSYESVRGAVLSATGGARPHEAGSLPNDKKVCPFHQFVTVALVRALIELAGQEMTQDWTDWVVSGQSALTTLASVLDVCTRAALKHPSTIPMLMRQSVPDLGTARVFVEAEVRRHRAESPHKSSMLLDVLIIAAGSSGHQPSGLLDEGARVTLLDVFNMAQASGSFGITLAAVDSAEARNVIAQLQQFPWSLDEANHARLTDSLLQNYQEACPWSA